jgi:hypothetical protein
LRAAPRLLEKPTSTIAGCSTPELPTKATFTPGYKPKHAVFGASYGAPFFDLGHVYGVTFINLYYFVQDSRFADVPAHTRYLINTSLLDILGVASGANQNQATGCITTYVDEHYVPGALASRLLFGGHSVHPLGAAWAGGFCIDSRRPFHVQGPCWRHSGAIVVPALLALMDSAP